ncbi:FAD/NAD(P)-binding domain-containing protein [Penicillium bovifimosum]|uniref:FAD/NAD(P)-binding domain-containing protein n=1 Tax=Penicillium bovifimosum TaxID=126998 RepID=A0A9W9GVZ5_9EURO|nr:FAD/NAD(P)-binding domain-containing protein [Penicillium bovifimosum]KAJ5131070.1 FAD/NAD(P)-binding domain-containing protein [Penicillium bovifimosum]
MSPKFDMATIRDNGVHVIVVGLGIAGLATAIECREKGHSVTAYEKTDILRPVGDCIGIASNGSRIIGRWGNGAVSDKLSPWRFTAKKINISNGQGRRILQQDLTEVCKETNYLIPRAQLLRTMYNHAQQIGVKLYLGRDVTDTWETDTQAGVIVDNERVTADCVICCDGVHSKRRRAVTGENLATRPSGYAAFRALIDGEKVAADPRANWIVETSEAEDRFDVFFVNGAQIALQTSNRGKEVTWFCIHKDSRPLLDSWTSPSNPQEVIDLMKDWPVGDRLLSVIRHTPANKFINYPLFEREPLPTWVSHGGRIILAGDAAHPLSPAAGQGASQGIEDAAVIAVCLQLAGKNQAPLALRVAEKIRYTFRS